MAMTPDIKNSMLDSGFGTGASSGTYMSLHSGDPTTTVATALANEIAGGSPAYARKQLNFNAASGGSKTLAASAVFDIQAGDAFSYYALWSVSTSGTQAQFKGSAALSGTGATSSATGSKAGAGTAVSLTGTGALTAGTGTKAVAAGATSLAGAGAFDLAVGAKAVSATAGALEGTGAISTATGVAATGESRTGTALDLTGAGAVSLASGWRASSGSAELVESAQLGAAMGTSYFPPPSVRRWRYPGRPAIRRR